MKAEELAKKEKAKKQQKIIAEFSYDNTLEETDDAIKILQKNFYPRRGKLSIIAYSFLGVASIAAIVFNPTQVVLYIALAFCAYGLFFTLTEKKRTRKAVLDTIMKMNPEVYRCTIFDDRVEIDTIIKTKDVENSEVDEGKTEVDEDKTEVDEENSEVDEVNTEVDEDKTEVDEGNSEVDEGKTEVQVENSEDVENVEEDFQPIKCVYRFGEDMLDFLEDDISLFLVIARRQVYCFPRRCLSDEQQTAIREFLTKKLSSLDF